LSGRDGLISTSRAINRGDAVFLACSRLRAAAFSNSFFKNPTANTSAIPGKTALPVPQRLEDSCAVNEHLLPRQISFAFALRLRKMSVVRCRDEAQESPRFTRMKSVPAGKSRTAIEPVLFEAE